jgi:hypothetical protein
MQLPTSLLKISQCSLISISKFELTFVLCVRIEKSVVIVIPIRVDVYCAGVGVGVGVGVGFGFGWARTKPEPERFWYARSILTFRTAGINQSNGFNY